MNVCTLVRPAGERVTVGGGCRSSGAKASFRATLRGGRGSAGNQSRSRWPSPPPPSSTITITDGAAAVKLRQRTAPRSVVTVPPAWASQSVKRASPPCTVPVVFSTTRPMGNRDWSWTKSVRLMVHPSAPPWTSIVAPRRPLPMNALSPQPVGRRFQTRSWRARNTGQSTRDDLVWNRLPTGWGESAFIGNGQIVAREEHGPIDAGRRRLQHQEQRQQR